MKKYLKLSALAVISTALVTTAAVSGLPEAKTEANTLTDYLSDKGVSHMLINSEQLTTFGWLAATKACADIKNAGFSVARVRNIEEATRAETVSNCSE